MLPPIRTYLKRHIPTFMRRQRSRAERVADELRFWDKWFKKKGLQWPDDYRSRLDPDSPLAEEYCECIEHLPQYEIRILDVGAGPLTVLGKKHPSKRLVIVAVDVLAEKYDELLDRYHVCPAVRTTFAEAEHLTRWFAENSFDLVNARNCLDHAVDPVEAVRQMLLVTKKNCFAVLDHLEKEGEHQRYSGLHQWNFAIAEGEFLVKGAGVVTNVSRQLVHLGDFRCFLSKGWVKVRIRKK